MILKWPHFKCMSVHYFGDRWNNIRYRCYVNEGQYSLNVFQGLQSNAFWKPRKVRIKTSKEQTLWNPWKHPKTLEKPTGPFETPGFSLFLAWLEGLDEVWFFSSRHRITCRGLAELPAAWRVRKGGGWFSGLVVLGFSFFFFLGGVCVCFFFLRVGLKELKRKGRIFGVTLWWFLMCFAMLCFNVRFLVW